MAHIPHGVVREEVREILGMPGASWPEIHAKIKAPLTYGEAESVGHAQEVIIEKMDGARRMC